MLRQIETTMDPSHPSNQQAPVDLGGAEETMAEAAKRLEDLGTEYHDDEQGW
jgi:hypothetical protein